jgi:hypothetical protein
MTSDRQNRREPYVADMIADPVVQAVMARDGVTAEDLLSLVVRMRERLRDAGAQGRSAA